MLRAYAHGRPVKREDFMSKSSDNIFKRKKKSSVDRTGIHVITAV